jgi:hypothetical protein
LEAVQVLAVFTAQGIVIGQGGSELLEYLTNNLPICGAEVGAKRLSTGEEEDVGDYI